MTALYWTAADDAELRVLTIEFCNGEAEHRERCSVCSQRGPWCEHVRAALEEILLWQERRRAHSFAAAMRAMQNKIDNGSVAA